jgi:hypothetical protein
VISAVTGNEAAGFSASQFIRLIGVIAVLKRQKPPLIPAAALGRSIRDQ